MPLSWLFGSASYTSLVSTAGQRAFVAPREERGYAGHGQDPPWLVQGWLRWFEGRFLGQFTVNTAVHITGYPTAPSQAPFRAVEVHVLRWIGGRQLWCWETKSHSHFWPSEASVHQEQMLSQVLLFQKMPKWIKNELTTSKKRWKFINCLQNNQRISSLWVLHYCQ